MTRFAYIAAALTAFVAVPAAAENMGDKPAMNDFRATNTVQVERRAGEVYTSRELATLGFDADKMVSVSSFPSGGRPDDSSRDRM
ncbi:hypothetical protein [Paracoccus sp. JM45]|uniref:hypothetical protein n=1 Tax=Paracoccus sp. JM45 TaxID=2283626 RepID=UPI000E6D4C05|nr:hypothetical protein [Paracoccus sp. JM45]RJE79750.1 hypothetical protein DWB67_10170 [Paracoccus sp. JM45]